MKNLSLFLLLAAFSIAAKAQLTTVSTAEVAQKLKASADSAFAHQLYQQAFNDYDQLIKFEPNNGKAFRRLGYICSISEHMTSLAIGDLKRAIEIDPTDHVSYLLLGNIYADMASQEKNPDFKAKQKALAESNYKKAADLGDEDAKVAIKSLNGI